VTAAIQALHSELSQLLSSFHHELSPEQLSRKQLLMAAVDLVKSEFVVRPPQFWRAGYVLWRNDEKVFKALDIDGDFRLGQSLADINDGQLRLALVTTQGEDGFAGKVIELKPSPLASSADVERWLRG
jgi:hypothetical protein